MFTKTLNQVTLSINVIIVQKCMVSNKRNNTALCALTKLLFVGGPDQILGGTQSF